MIMLIKLALRNIFRNKRRSLLTIGAVVISIMIVTALLSLLKGMKYMVVDNVTSNTGQVQIMDQRFFEKQRTLPLKYAVKNYQQVRAVLQKQLPDAELISGRILFGGMLGKEEIEELSACLAFDPSIDRNPFQLANSLVAGRLCNADQPEAVIGRKLADKLKIGLGDELLIVTRTIYNSMGALTVTISGIADFPVDRANNLVLVPLSLAQRALDMENAVSQILINHRSSRTSETIKSLIQTSIPLAPELNVYTWRDDKNINAILTMLSAGESLYFIIIQLLALIGIFNTMFTNVYERTTEIGLLSAMGLNRRKTIILFLLEAGGMGAIGAGIGVIIGGFFAFLLSRYGWRMPAEGFQNMGIDFNRTLYGDFSLGLIARTFLIGLIFAMLAGLIPAIKAARLEPSQALRKIA